jgi:hypothetical protein
MVKVSTTAFFTIPDDSVVEPGHYILVANETATPTRLVPILGWMNGESGEVFASETEMQDILNVTLVDYMTDGDIIDEVPF